MLERQHTSCRGKNKGEKENSRIAVEEKLWIEDIRQLLGAGGKLQEAAEEAETVRVLLTRVSIPDISEQTERPAR